MGGIGQIVNIDLIINLSINRYFVFFDSDFSLIYNSCMIVLNKEFFIIEV